MSSCLSVPIRLTVGFLLSCFHLLSCVHSGLLLSLNNSQIQLSFFATSRASQILETGMNVRMSRPTSIFFFFCKPESVDVAHKNCESLFVGPTKRWKHMFSPASREQDYFIFCHLSLKCSGLSLCLQRTSQKELLRNVHGLGCFVFICRTLVLKKGCFDKQNPFIRSP